MVAVGPETVPAERRPRPRRLGAHVVGLMVVGALIGVVGCGGDDDDDAGGDSGTETTAAAADGTASSTETSEPTVTTTTAPVVVSTPTISSAPGYSPEPADGPLRQGMSGQRVYLLQSQLTALEYDPGPLDGLFGSKTHEAVVAFQRDKTLTMDGVVGPQTAAALAAACEPVPACPKG